jgi:hypothetical protein
MSYSWIIRHFYLLSNGTRQVQFDGFPAINLFTASIFQLATFDDTGGLLLLYPSCNLAQLWNMAQNGLFSLIICLWKIVMSHSCFKLPEGDPFPQRLNIPKSWEEKMQSDPIPSYDFQGPYSIFEGLEWITTSNAITFRTESTGSLGVAGPSSWACYKTRDLILNGSV